MAIKILIVDDSEMIRKVVEMTLSTEGHTVIQAVDGEDALKKLDGRQIDICICDVNMPVMDGLTFLHAVKNDTAYAEYKFMPVIMLTTEASPEMKERGKIEGARVWLVKPFQPDELLEAVKKILV